MPFQRGNMGRPATPPIVRFWRYVDKTETCWLWTGGKVWDGYGRFRLPDRTVRAHKFLWENVNGPVPDGLQLDHLCRVRSCVRPDHLEPVTVRENLLRGDTHQARNIAKTHCLRGHPFDEANTYWRRGHRHCRACSRDKIRARRAARRAA